MSDEPWRPHPGALVQIWDYQYERGQDKLNSFISGHGSVGYVVRQSGGDKSDQAYSTIADGPVFEVICFGDNGSSSRYDVWHGWLREIKRSSDIKKLSNESR